MYVWVPEVRNTADTPYYIFIITLFTLVLNSPDGEWPITYTRTYTFISAKQTRQ